MGVCDKLQQADVCEDCVIIHFHQKTSCTGSLESGDNKHAEAGASAIIHHVQKHENTLVGGTDRILKLIFACVRLTNTLFIGALFDILTSCACRRSN